MDSKVLLAKTLIGMTIIFGIWLFGTKAGWFPSGEKIVIHLNNGNKIKSSKWYFDFDGDYILIDRDTTILNDDFTGVSFINE